MISFLIGIAGSVIGLVGWFNSYDLIWLVLGTIAVLIEQILEEDNLSSKAKTQNLSAFVVGAVAVSFSRYYPWDIGGLLAVIIWNIFISILGVLFFIYRYNKYK